MDDNRPFINVEFSKGRLHMSQSSLVDTGASGTCITEEIAKRLKLYDGPYEIMKVESVGGTITVRKYRINLQIEGHVFRDHPVVVLPLPYSLIGWDILSAGIIMSSISNRIFSEVIHLLGSIGSFKKATVLGEL